MHIELYTDEKNPETEAQVEEVLDRHGIFYDKTEVWIEEEKLYEVLWSFERKVTNPETEAQVEEVLDHHGIFYDKTEVWIEEEKLYEVLWSFERKVKDNAYEEE